LTGPNFNIDTACNANNERNVNQPKVWFTQYANSQQTPIYVDYYFTQMGRDSREENT
jgi:hypothetical protein